MSWMWNRGPSFNPCGIGVRNVELRANSLDREVGQSRQNISPISIFIEPSRKFAGIPLTQGDALLSLSSRPLCFGGRTVRGDAPKFRLVQKIFSINEWDTFCAIR